MEDPEAVSLLKEMVLSVVEQCTDASVLDLVLKILTL